MNDDWEPEFIANKEITNKQFSVKDFAVYMNFSNDRSAVLFDELTKGWPETDQNSKYMRFLKQECSFANPDNQYIIERFCLDLRVSLNKNVKNKEP